MPSSDRTAPAGSALPAGAHVEREKLTPWNSGSEALSSAVTLQTGLIFQAPGCSLGWQAPSPDLGVGHAPTGFLILLVESTNE